MYCPNCGTGGLDSDANFCPSCGSPISNPQTQTSPSNTTQTLIQQPIRQQPIRQQPTYSAPLFQYRTEGAGPNSKKALGFSIASLCLLVAGLIVGGGSVLSSIMASRYSSYPYYYVYPTYPYNMSPSIGIIGLIPAIAMNALGLIFAIIARVNASRGKSEMEGGARKVGAVFSVLGIVFNSIALGFALLVAPVIIYGLSQTPYYPYYPYYP